MRRLITLLIAAAGAVVAISPAYAIGRPIGYDGLCRERPLYCRADKATLRADKPISFSPELLWQLLELNIRWNRTIIPLEDEEEEWSGSTISGDCEEFAIAKKMELLKFGFSASQLLLTFVKHGKDEGHLVLVVRTSIGELVLDNRTNELTFWEAAEYRLHSRQHEDSPSFWTETNFR